MTTALILSLSAIVLWWAVCLALVAWTILVLPLAVLVGKALAMRDNKHSSMVR